jgi:predicted ATPase/class 3 adenylate cyclase
MTPVGRELPAGTVTFLFTDVEGSTKLLHELGAAEYAQALAEHRRILRQACAAHSGVEVDTQGDAFFFAFETAPDALEAARETLAGLASGRIGVRIGIHSGVPHMAEEGYVGADVHKGARIGAAGHGGQVLLSKETRELVAVEVTDLGEHRLKDFAEPIWIFQLGAERFPPLKTISNTNLPRPTSSLVGREREVEEVLALVHDGARLLTLTGPGGSGKTRLALEVAAELVPEFQNGVLWVGLAPLRDPALVSETVARTLGSKDGLAEHIGERELLLLLDNLEQVVEAAPELASLVETCSNLQLLVTSRELLRVRGEVEYPVLPLADPEAVELFCARARTEPEEAVRELCRALDNLPLALELAAARASVLSPQQILDRVSTRLDLLRGGRDADPRQATLRATIEWSYDLLPERERRLFARLAVFRGGCTLDAAEEVAEADLDTLQALVDKSLLRHTDERFWMLETIREYAAERLEESGQAKALRRQHAEHFLALAEEAEPSLRTESREWLDRLEREHDNLRAALDHLEASGESERVLRLAGAAAPFWSSRDHRVEGRRRLENALSADASPTAARAKALIGAADIAVDTSDVAAVRLRAEEGLALYQTLGDAWGAAYATVLFGNACADAGDLAPARQLFEESARAFRELGDQHHTLLATRLLAWMHDALGDREGARALHEQNLLHARTLGNEPIEATTLGALASYAVDEGRVVDAVSLAGESLRVYHHLGDLGGTAIELCRCAAALALKGRARTAVRLLSSSEALREEIGLSVRPYLAAENEATLATIRTQLDDGAFAEAWEQGRKLTAGEAVAVALDALD